MLAVACPEPRATADCGRYRPAEAKRTFDGRVGTIVLHNASPATATARVYHPDGDGTQAEETWALPPGADSTLGGGFGSDWGLQVDASCTVLLGHGARWIGGTFVVTWTGDTLVPGLPRRGETAGARPD